MKINNIDGEVVKDNETYILKDNTSLNNFVISSTTLHAGKSTKGHSHAGKEDLYMVCIFDGERENVYKT